MERVVGGRKQESKETLLLKEDYFKFVEKFISRGVSGAGYCTCPPSGPCGEDENRNLSMFLRM